ncbi:MAG: hypothetical protein LBR43_01345 [Spiroplasmataceae bacterium]|nr:hypothetical protein [Spiroplasmataceae bacterium]
MKKQSFKFKEATEAKNKEEFNQGKIIKSVVFNDSVSKWLSQEFPSTDFSKVANLKVSKVGFIEILGEINKQNLTNGILSSNLVNLRKIIFVDEVKNNKSIINNYLRIKEKFAHYLEIPEMTHLENRKSWKKLNICLKITQIKNDFFDTKSQGSKQVIEFLEEVKFVVEGSPLISYQPARLKKQKKSNESLTNESNPISSEFSQKTNDDPKVIGRLRDNVRKLRKQQIENSRTIAELNINLNDAKGQISELKKEKNHFHNQSETFGGLFWEQLKKTQALEKELNHLKKNSSEKSRIIEKLTKTNENLKDYCTELTHWKEEHNNCFIENLEKNVKNLEKELEKLLFKSQVKGKMIKYKNRGVSLIIQQKEAINTLSFEVQFFFEISEILREQLVKILSSRQQLLDYLQKIESRGGEQDLEIIFNNCVLERAHEIFAELVNSRENKIEASQEIIPDLRKR